VKQQEDRMQTVIAIQSELIAKVNACQTGHLRRVRRAARRAAAKKLAALGWSEADTAAMVQDAVDMAELERAAD
jgi:hypothetical protein